MTKSYASLSEMNMPFKGAKLAILIEDHVLVLLRDDKADIPFPAFWDLPGGGREGTETPVDCVVRETQEELTLNVPPKNIAWGTCHGEGSDRTWFFVMHGQQNWLPDVRLGSEGQKWQAMPVAEFLTHPRAVPHFQTRLANYIRSAGEAV